MSKETDRKNRWIADHADRISLAVPKGLKEVIKAHADAAGESVTTYIVRSIKARIDSEE